MAEVNAFGLLAEDNDRLYELDNARLEMSDHRYRVEGLKLSTTGADDKRRVGLSMLARALDILNEAYEEDLKASQARGKKASRGL